MNNARTKHGQTSRVMAHVGKDTALWSYCEALARLEGSHAHVLSYWARLAIWELLRLGDVRMVNHGEVPSTMRALLFRLAQMRASSCSARVLQCVCVVEEEDAGSLPPLRRLYEWSISFPAQLG